MVTSLTMPRSVIGLLISGSCTPASALRTASWLGSVCALLTGSMLRTAHPSPAGQGCLPYDLYVPDQAVSRVPDEDQLRAWRSFLRAHARISRLLEAELVAERNLSLGAYDVLVQLAEAPQRRLRMAELADAVLLSRSGVTRLVDRLEGGGDRKRGGE